MLWSKPVHLTLVAGFCLISIQSAAKLSEAQIKEKCEVKKDGPACFDMAFAELAKATPEGRKSARVLFKKACAYTKKKNRCTELEIKTTARASRWKPDRMPASTGRPSVGPSGKLKVLPKLASSAPPRGPSNIPRPEYQRPDMPPQQPAINEPPPGAFETNNPLPMINQQFQPPPPQPYQDPNLAMAQQPGYAPPPQGGFNPPPPMPGTDGTCTPDNPNCEASK